MNLIKKNIPVLVSVLGIVAVLWGCEKERTYVSPQEYLDRETELLNRYYNEEMPNGLSRLDVTTAEAIDTVDKRNESGMMLYHTKIGTGDSIKAYKKVGYRFKKYAVVDSSGVTLEYLVNSNYYSYAQSDFTTYPIYQQSGSAIEPGINEAVQHMRLYGESKVVVPSPIGLNAQYTTYVYEIEVTYLGQ
jgi:hypothetical protein